ncbi:hypothetical protein SAMN04488134_10735 [Amphibacillus marinus]|uniref:Uncharacterized protein n=1 Tax=Amphibacillus marinus TaxID=872970 RepID=A0A1H8PDJ0_9BACI|nr:hypothetical protein [Amphibacillus marinus]SEO39896.1 hypothetical protein SAMN04488134_10735 [Amphibacillus marinus]
MWKIIILLFFLTGCSPKNTDVLKITVSLSENVTQQSYLIVIDPLESPQHIDFLPTEYGNIYATKSNLTNGIELTVERDLLYNLSVYRAQDDFEQSVNKREYLDFVEEQVAKVELTFDKADTHYVLILDN